MKLRDRFLRRIFILGALVVIIMPWLMEGLAVIDPLRPIAPIARQDTAQTAAANDNAPTITPSRAQHILYGDGRGGGHLYGVGRPCKSEFPQGWDAQKIIYEVQKAAANDNAGWKQQNNGYYVADISIDTLRVRVVLDENKGSVITAYPVNVKRNPCPAANDNLR